MAAPLDTSRIMGIVLLSLTVVLCYQGWKNTNAVSTTKHIAKDHACDLDGSCIVTGDEATMAKTNPLWNDFEFTTTHGIMTVSCHRSLYFFGPWECTTREGRLVNRAL
ncbi:hypothetical protein [Plesiocystis pacifica]|nr:hypothetical protein [Plesiocystis pacifica]